jgi:regulator of sigma E protease
MSIILFIIVLGVLIFVHELGHFLVAKKSGIRVDEFAIGFPPRIFSFTKGGTRYALNLIPFGGYVKIFGESPEDGADDKNAKDSMINKPKWIQALVLVAGVTFNIIFAWFIFFLLFVRGGEFNSNIVPYMPQTEGVRVSYIAPDSVAMNAGLVEGSIVKSVTLESGEVFTDNEKIFETLYAQNKEKTILTVQDNNTQTKTIELIPKTADTKFGFSLTDQVVIKTNPIKASIYAVKTTAAVTKLTAVGLYDFFAKLFTGNANFKEVAGPVGIVGLVGKAAENGLNDVLFLTAIISINLAVLNLLPFPALDGGRLVIVAIEAIMRKDLNYQKVAIVNTIGFFLLITLMIVLTFHDIKNLFN